MVLFLLVGEAGSVGEKMFKLCEKAPEFMRALAVEARHSMVAIRRHWWFWLRHRDWLL